MSCTFFNYLINSITMCDKMTSNLYNNSKRCKYCVCGTADLQVTASPGSCWSFSFGLALASWGGFVFPRWTHCGGICPHHTLKSWEEKNRSAREHEWRDTQVSVLLLRRGLKLETIILYHRALPQGYTHPLSRAIGLIALNHNPSSSAVQ